LTETSATGTARTSKTTSFKIDIPKIDNAPSKLMLGNDSLLSISSFRECWE
jgi:hypothetical protein